MSWRQSLNPEELAWLHECEAFFDHAPSRAGLGVWLEKKLHKLVAHLPESLVSQVTGAVQSALDHLLNGSSWLVDPKAFEDKLVRRMGRSSRELGISDLELVAAELISDTTTGLTIEGAAAGAAGLLGLVADIPILYCSLFKTIQELALLYGFPAHTKQERYHILACLDLGHSLHSAGRSALVYQALEFQSLIAQGADWELLEAKSAGRSSGTQTHALTRNLRLARQLALDLLERKLLQGLVVVGSAIGAASNYQLAKDVGQASRNLYRYRLLKEVGQRRAQENSPPAGN
jgi:hypothetical protein